MTNLLLKTKTELFVDNRRTVLLINAVIRLSYINMFQHSYFTTIHFLGLR